MSDAPTSRILVAVSSPEASRRVGNLVADLAGRLGAEVLVVHVTKPVGGQNRDDEQSAGEQAVRIVADHVRVKEVRVQTLLLFADDVSRAILNTATDRAATMIVLGLTGRGALGRLISGNVPVELLRNAKVPVLLLPPDATQAV